MVIQSKSAENHCHKSSRESLLVHIHIDMSICEAKPFCWVQIRVGLYFSVCSVMAKLYSVLRDLLFLLLTNM